MRARGKRGNDSAQLPPNEEPTVKRPFPRHVKGLKRITTSPASCPSTRGSLSQLGEDGLQHVTNRPDLQLSKEESENHLSGPAKFPSTQDSFAESTEETLLPGSPIYKDERNHLDNERPIKIRRLSGDVDSRISDASNQSSHENQSTNSNNEIAAYLERQNGDYEHEQEDGDMVEPRASQTWANRDPNLTEPSTEFLPNEDPKSLLPPRFRGKRPKGWHLRKENRHLRKALFKGSPARSERQESMDEIDPSKYEPGGLIKRLPGRRRAPHSDPDVEANLRRQLELKVVYRAVAKALKPVLAELAQRTEHELEWDEKAHKCYEGYKEITGELDDRLRERLQVLESELQLEEERLARMHEADTILRRKQYEQMVEDRLDDIVSRCKEQVLSMARDHDKEGDSEATDNEDGIINNQYGTQNAEGIRKPIAVDAESRSRRYLEIDRIWSELETRRRFVHEQRAYDKTSLFRKPRGFAVYDQGKRIIDRAELNLLKLHGASTEVAKMEAKARRKASNAAAIGLQALVTATDIAPLQASNSKRAMAQVGSNQLEAGRTKFSTKRVEPVPIIDASNPSESTSNRSPWRKRQNTRSATETSLYYDPIHGSNQSMQKHPVESSKSHQLPQLAAKSSHENFTMSPKVSRETDRTEYKYDKHTSQTSIGSTTISDQNAKHVESHGRPWYIKAETQRTHQPSVQPTEPDGLPRMRKRPGPQPKYTPQAHTNTSLSPLPRKPEFWSPFTNSMGPPTYLPKYVRGAELQRRSSLSNVPLPPPTTSTADDSNSGTYSQLLPTTQAIYSEPSQPISQGLQPILQDSTQPYQTVSSLRPERAFALHASIPSSPRPQAALVPMTSSSPQRSPTSSVQPSQGAQRHYPTFPLYGYAPRPTESYAHGHAFPRHFRASEQLPVPPIQPLYTTSIETLGSRGAPGLPPYSHLPSAPNTPSFGPVYPHQGQYQARNESVAPPNRGQYVEHVASGRISPEVRRDSKGERVQSLPHTGVNMEAARSQGLPGIQTMQTGEPSPSSPVSHSIQRHPGQRIGQQLLPATMDPAKHGGRRYEQRPTTPLTQASSTLPPLPPRIDTQPPALQPAVEIKDHSRRPSQGMPTEREWAQTGSNAQHMHAVPWPPPPGVHAPPFAGYSVLPPPQFQHPRIEQQPPQQQQQQQQPQAPLPHRQPQLLPPEQYQHFTAGYAHGMQPPPYPGSAVLPPFQAHPIQTPQNQHRRSRGPGRGSGRGGRRRRHSSPPVS